MSIGMVKSPSEFSSLKKGFPAGTLPRTWISRVAVRTGLPKADKTSMAR